MDRVCVCCAFHGKRQPSGFEVSPPKNEAQLTLATFGDFDSPDQAYFSFPSDLLHRSSLVLCRFVLLGSDHKHLPSSHPWSKSRARLHFLFSIFHFPDRCFFLQCAQLAVVCPAPSLPKLAITNSPCSSSSHRRVAPLGLLTTTYRGRRELLRGWAFSLTTTAR